MYFLQYTRKLFFHLPACLKPLKYHYEYNKYNPSPHSDAESGVHNVEIENIVLVNSVNDTGKQP